MIGSTSDSVEVSACSRGYLSGSAEIACRSARTAHTVGMESLFDRVTRWFAEGPFHRWPWLLPAISFAAGWAGFALIQRGETAARSIAVMALLGWPLLLAENLLGNWLGRLSRGRLSPALLGFVTQNLQQELLFFSLPFLIGATQRDAGQIAFTTVVALGALISTLDPVYHRYVAARPGISVVFHAFCTFIASLVVLPVAVGMPLELALPVALAASGLWVTLSLPRMLAGVSDLRTRLFGMAAVLVSLLALWLLRANVPPAGLSLKYSRITQSLEGLRPGPALTRVDAQTLLTEGAVAFVSIRAPAGLAQSVVFEWWHRGERLDQVPAGIEGGSEAGWRTYTRKHNFPADPRGRWRVDVLTPQGQLICRLPFVVN